MKLDQLFESDESLRALEREAFSDPSALIKLAQGYLRAGDPRIEELIQPLREIEDPSARELIRIWAQNNDIPTAESFVLGLSRTSGEIDMGDSVLENAAAASERARNSRFWLVEQDESGRGGYAAGVEIWESPAGGSVWLVWEQGYGQDNFNYGIVDPKDHAWATSEDGEGILDYYRDYLY